MYETAKETLMYRTVLWTLWEREKGRCMEQSTIEIYNTTYKTDSQWEFAVWLRELKQRLFNRLKSGVGREMGGRSGRQETWVYLWLILVDIWQKTTKFCKAIILQLKNLKKNCMSSTEYIILSHNSIPKLQVCLVFKSVKLYTFLFAKANLRINKKRLWVCSNKYLQFLWVFFSFSPTFIKLMIFLVCPSWLTK